MQIKIKKSELVEILNLMSLVVKENKIRPVLSQVLITANEEIKITGTDLEQTLICKVTGDIIEQGQTTFDIKEGLELLKLSDMDELEIKTEGTQLDLGNMTFVTQDYTEFPVLNIEENESIEIQSIELVSNIKKTIIAAGIDSSNIEINCVRVGNNIMAATDSFRMCVLETGLNLPDASVPLNSANNLTKILAKTDKVNLFVESNKMIVSSEYITYITRLIDLPFVDIKNIMNNINTDKKAVIDSISLQKILKKMIVVAKNSFEAKNAAVFEFKSGMLYINTKNEKVKIKEKMKIYYSGEDIKASLNCKFILDFTSNIKNMVEINFSNNNSAFMICEEGKEGYKYLTMPLALKE